LDFGVNNIDQNLNNRIKNNGWYLKKYNWLWHTTFRYTKVYFNVIEDTQDYYLLIEKFMTF
jgi:hypothetical protein